jgi:Domain of unknown function (DUF1707)
VTQDTPAIRASDAEREQAVELLRTHAVEGRLTLAEFAERVEQAYAARTRDDLDELKRDLPTDEPKRASGRRRSPRWLVSILGGVDRRGRIRLAAETIAVTFLGGIDLDLRDAEIEAAESRLTLLTLLGGVDIKVPEGVDVELHGLSFLGGKDFDAGRKPTPPGAPRLTIHAYTLLGGVSIATRASRS